MSFSTDVKAELSFVEREKCCEKAQLAALIQILSTMNITSTGLQLTIRSENPTIAKKIWKLIKSIYDVDTELSVIKKVKLKKNRVYVIKVLNSTREILEDLTLWIKDGLQNKPSKEITAKRCCAQSYLAGCFLASGSVNSPVNSNYHLEIATTNLEHAQHIQKVIKQLNLSAKIIERRKHQVVYIKSGELIIDFLAHIGAQEASFAYADIRINRDFMNSITRLENCATANDVKSIQAAQKQIGAIEKIEMIKGTEYLEEISPGIAKIRVENPDASLNELAVEYSKLTGTKLSKSGMKHRLTKFEKIAEKL